MLDLLERYPGCAVPFAVYLDLLPALQPRYYSISSSPLVSPDVCSITAGVLRAPARGGDREFAGVASNYLASMAPNSTIFVFRREPTIPFRPPADPGVGMIMIGAGTGLAPFRGFLQERAAQKARGESLAPSLLFFGCRNPEHDYLYADEMLEFEKTADVRVYPAFSRQPRDGPQVRPGRDARPPGRDLGPHREERVDLRLRQRPDPGTWGAGRAHPDRRQQDRAVRRRVPNLARQPPRRTPLPGGHLGRRLTGHR